jgi:asparagine synthetase B (glutamine-hydrolysing)
MRGNSQVRFLGGDGVVIRCSYPTQVEPEYARAAMGVSLESRVPFLDHRVVEFA